MATSPLNNSWPFHSSTDDLNLSLVPRGSIGFSSLPNNRPGRLRT